MNRISNYGPLSCPPLRFGQVSGEVHTGMSRLKLTENHRETKLGFLKWHNFDSQCPASLYRLAQNALHLERFNHQLDSVINVKARVNG